MILKKLEDITEAVLQALITDAVLEGRTIDYKQALPGTADADKKEFLADVSSFANTSGGDLVYGMAESQGAPTQISGLGIVDPELEVLRLESILASGLEPRVRHAATLVPVLNGEKVLVIRVERSWIGPHRVVFKGHGKFHGRNSAGKYSLDVEQLRAAFTFSTAVNDRIRAFRTDPIIELANNQTPIPFVESPKLVLHCIPIESFAGNPQYDVLQYDQPPWGLHPMSSSGSTREINLEGIVSCSNNNPAFSYTQLYRSGIIEAVHGELLDGEYQGKRTIPSIAYEEAVFKYLPFCFQILQHLGCNVPIAVALSLINVRGLRMGAREFSFVDKGHPIKTDTLILPEVVVEDYSTPVGKILKPMFDLVWNACGHPRSSNFDEAANWVQRR